MSFPSVIVTIPTFGSFSSEKMISDRSRWIWSATRKLRPGIDLLCLAMIHSLQKLTTVITIPQIQGHTGEKSQGTGNFLDFIHLDLVTDLDVIVIFQGQTTLETGLDLFHIILEALQCID